MHTSRFGTFQKMIGSTLAAALITVLAIFYLDLPLATFVKNHLYANTSWSKLTSDMPDLLLLVVLFSMLASLSAYLVRSRRGLYDATTFFCQLVLWVAPLSYLAKMVLKIAFGRINTRYWLQHPDLYGFYFFQMRERCDGFPSGHMLVIVAIIAAVWRFYPKTRPLCLLTGTLLGCALIATNYHFLSDVIAGASLGIALEAICCRLLIREPLQLPADRC